MKAAQIEGVRGRISVAEVEIPELEPDDALVRVVASGIAEVTGICGTGTGNGSE